MGIVLSPREEVVYGMIVSRRKALGITQGMMAKRFGISARAYGRWESGGMGLSEFLGVCEYLELRFVFLDPSGII